jgi:DNA-binding LytR/AlgR family response regulator
VNNLSYPLHTNILYLEADVNYTIFHLINGKKIISSFTLKKYEQKQELGAFLRVNKSYLLNPNFIKNCQKKGNKTSVELSNGKIVQVSRRKVGLVKGLISA